MNCVIDAAEYFFHQGTNYRAYEYMGSHVTKNGERVFRVWAKNAVSVSLVGDFCTWDDGVPMTKVTDGGVWECTLSADCVKVGQKYKYKIRTADGKRLYKSDPYCACAETPPNGASVIYDGDRYTWRDAGWMSYRRSKSGRLAQEPISIYRLSVTEWTREIKSWSWLAAELAPYVKQMGYTHIELTNVDQKAFVYAVRSDMGAPDDFKAFVDSMHEAGVGVIIDRYMTYSSFEDYGLYNFDGQPLYECPDGSGRYELSSREVESFLISNARYWLDVYHVDGLRFCGIEPELNMEELGFFRKLEAHVKADFPDVLALFEKTATDGKFGILTSPVFYGDMARYRAEYGYFMTVSGKKITQMGAEIASNQGSPDWSLLGLEAHAKFQRYSACLGQTYLQNPALWQNEKIEEAPCKYEESIMSFERLDSCGEAVMILINLTPVAYENYRVGVPCKGAYREILNSDDGSFGGGGYVNDAEIKSQSRPWRGCENSIVMRIAPMSISVLKCVGTTITIGK